MEPRASLMAVKTRAMAHPQQQSSARVSGSLYSQARERYNSYLGEQGGVAPKPAEAGIQCPSIEREKGYGRD